MTIFGLPIKKVQAAFAPPHSATFMKFYSHSERAPSKQRLQLELFGVGHALKTNNNPNEAWEAGGGLISTAEGNPHELFR